MGKVNLFSAQQTFIMKVAIILCAFMAIAYGEMCKDTASCTQHGITNCGSGYNVVCEHHQCMCTNGPTGTACVSQSDCSGCQQGQRPHCIDGKCHCTRF